MTSTLPQEPRVVERERILRDLEFILKTESNREARAVARRLYLDRALTRVINRNGGLAFFTDDQIAEIRAELIQREWSVTHAIRRRNRKLRAA